MEGRVVGGLDSLETQVITLNKYDKRRFESNKHCSSCQCSAERDGRSDSFLPPLENVSKGSREE